MGKMFEVGEEERGGVQISVDTFVLEFGNPYTLDLQVQISHTDDPLLATLEFSRMVNDNKDVPLS